LKELKGQEADYLIIDDLGSEIENENFEKQYQQNPVFYNGPARCVLGVENK
jgi:DNA replication protein DnaC